jgi:hypothetical protein
MAEPTRTHPDTRREPGKRNPDDPAPERGEPSGRPDRGIPGRPGDRPERAPKPDQELPPTEPTEPTTPPATPKSK